MLEFSRRARVLLVLAVCAGCQSVGTAGGGLGATGPRDVIVTQRYFAAPLAPVKAATLSAMSRVGVRHIGYAKSKAGEILIGAGPGGGLEVFLEPLGPNRTGMRVSAEKGFRAGAGEIPSELIEQTARLLGRT